MNVGPLCLKNTYPCPPPYTHTHTNDALVSGLASARQTPPQPHQTGRKHTWKRPPAPYSPYRAPVLPRTSHSGEETTQRLIRSKCHIRRCLGVMLRHQSWELFFLKMLAHGRELELEVG